MLKTSTSQENEQLSVDSSNGRDRANDARVLPAANSSASRLLASKAQDPPSQPRFTGSGALGSVRSSSASKPTEPMLSAEEERQIQLRLTDLDGLLDSVKVSYTYSEYAIVP